MSEPTFRINRVYTRSGDDGNTGLVGGERVSKSSRRVCAYGDIDELNSFLGLAKERLTPPTSDLHDVIELIQQELFDLGSELATATPYAGMWQASADHVTRLEQLCDRYNEGLPELHSFILPGGSELSGVLHVARAVARRAERTLVKLAEELSFNGHEFNALTIQYVNRLSDLLFVMSRWVLMKEGKEAPLWKKAEFRPAPEKK